MCPAGKPKIWHARKQKKREIPIPPEVGKTYGLPLEPVDVEANEAFCLRFGDCMTGRGQSDLKCVNKVGKWRRTTGNCFCVRLPTQILRACAVERHCEHFERHECTANSNGVAVYVSHHARTRRHKTQTITEKRFNPCFVGCPFSVASVEDCSHNRFKPQNLFTRNGAAMRLYQPSGGRRA